MARLANLFQYDGSGMADAMQMIQERQKQSKLASLLSGAYQAEGGNRQSLLAQAIGVDPQAGLTAARYLDPRVSDQNGMFAQKVGEDGYIYNAMRDGKMVNTGIKADRQMWFRDNAGMAPELVGKDGNVRPVGNYGAQVPQQQAPNPAIRVQYEGPESERAAFEALVAADSQQPFAPGEYSAELPPQNVTPQQRAWTTNTPNPYGNAMPGFTPAQAKPAMTPAQMLAAQNAQERLRIAQNADQRASESAGRGAIPQGYRMVNGRLEKMPGFESPTRVKINEAAAAKVPQLQNAIRGMSRIEDAINKLDGKLVNTGPMDAMVQKFTPAGQELDAAVGAIQNSVLALTRVPGIGSQSDLEARIAALQYPSLDKPPEVNRRTLANLKLFMRDLAEAYKLAVQPGQAQKADTREPRQSNAVNVDPLGIR